MKRSKKILAIMMIAIFTTVMMLSGIPANAFVNGKEAKKDIVIATSRVINAENAVKSVNFNTTTAQKQLSIGLQATQKLKAYGKANNSTYNKLNARLNIVKSKIQKKVAADKVKAAKAAALARSKKLAAEKLAAEKAEADRVAAEKMEADKLAADKLEADKTAGNITETFFGSKELNQPLAATQTMYVIANAATVSNVNFEKDLYIEANNVTINNVKVAGTIFVDPGKDGTSTLNNVVAAHIKVLSGGEHSIHFNMTSSGTLEIATDQGTTADNGSVRIVADADTKI